MISLHIWFQEESLDKCYSWYRVSNPIKLLINPVTQWRFHARDIAFSGITEMSKRNPCHRASSPHVRTEYMLRIKSPTSIYQAPSFSIVKRLSFPFKRPSMIWKAHKQFAIETRPIHYGQRNPLSTARSWSETIAQSLRSSESANPCTCGFILFLHIHARPATIGWLSWFLVSLPMTFRKLPAFG